MRGGRRVGPAQPPVAAVRTHDEYDRVEPAAGLVLARVALQPGKRDPARADCLLDVVAELAHRSGAGSVRLFVPGQVDWIRDAAYRANFRPVRTILHMLRPADAPRYTPPPVPELAVRSIRQGEEMNVLKVLNRAWAGTWNFLRIPLDMFLRDLEGQ